MKISIKQHSDSLWIQESGTTLASPEVPETSKSEEVDGSSSIRIEERTDKIEDQFTSNQVPTLAIHEKSPIQNSADGLAVNKESALQSSTDLGEPDKVFANGELESSESRGGHTVGRKVEEKGHGINAHSASSSSVQKNPDYSPRKVMCMLIIPIFDFVGSLCVARISKKHL